MWSEFADVDPHFFFWATMSEATLQPPAENQIDRYANNSLCRYTPMSMDRQLRKPPIKISKVSRLRTACPYYRNKDKLQNYQCTENERIVNAPAGQHSYECHSGQVSYNSSHFGSNVSQQYAGGRVNSSRGVHQHVWWRRAVQWYVPDVRSHSIPYYTEISRSEYAELKHAKLHCDFIPEPTPPTPPASQMASMASTPSTPLTPSTPSLPSLPPSPTEVEGGANRRQFDAVASWGWPRMDDSDPSSKLVVVNRYSRTTGTKVNTVALSKVVRPRNRPGGPCIFCTDTGRKCSGNKELRKPCMVCIERGLTCEWRKYASDSNA
ncbi:hypothetical protein CERSUDRAFT_117837 [Gelatoporia subvermispora B]|uniref:Zn(2)-C6 fungal-type domain-containing protein n=1 Tax=Ceriporiopsis subvermispora (strain B) TaxID=914234 RepID=M2QNK9_CERS8|nr:hypothetical protein CERSUDRAFT_117837 [Gelatoporia subvermispora B]